MSLRLRKEDRPDYGEEAISAPLAQFGDTWKTLISAEQARAVRRLVARAEQPGRVFD